MRRVEDLTGQKFGRLTVVRVLPREHGVRPRVVCACECGKTHETVSYRLKSGDTKSCGCLKLEIAGARLVAINSSHGRSRDRIYFCWQGMRSRCENPKHKYYQDYGGRGISVCPEWADFEVFATDMGEMPKGMTLDRRDNSKGYYKENCRWTTQKQQIANRRTSIYVPTDRGMFTLADYAKQNGVPYPTAYRWTATGKLAAIRPNAEV